jgi:chromosome partitioning protein
VPFRSREQRRGKHSGGSQSDFEADGLPQSEPELERRLPGSAKLGDLPGRVEESHDPNHAVGSPQNLSAQPPAEDLETDSTWNDPPDESDLPGNQPHYEIDDRMDDEVDRLDSARVSTLGSGDSLRVSTAVSGNGDGGAHKDSPDSPVEAAVSPDPVLERRPPIKLPRVVAVANQKGGVGKTTTAVNLGAGLAEIGFRVLVIDLDPQGNATTGLGIDARNFENSMYDVIMKDIALEDCIEPTSLKNLFVAPATIDLAGAEIELVPAFSREFKLRKAIQTVVDDFDYVLIDCPPSLGLITINGLAAAGEVLVPIQCEYYALEGLGQLLRNVQLVQSNLNEKLEVSTIVLTMYDARTKLAEQVASEVRAHFGPRVCRVVIPRTVRISEAPSFGQPITVFDPTSRGAIAYRELAKEVSGGET